EVRDGDGLELALYTLGQANLLDASATSATSAPSAASATSPTSGRPRSAYTPTDDVGGLAPQAKADAQAPATPPLPQRPASRNARGGAMNPRAQNAQNAQDARDPQAAPWTLRLPDFVHGRLSIDPRTGRWRVAGQNRAGDWVRVQGVLGNEIVDEAHW